MLVGFFTSNPCCLKVRLRRMTARGCRKASKTLNFTATLSSREAGPLGNTIVFRHSGRAEYRLGIN
jgi:hypothetical protein